MQKQPGLTFDLTFVDDEATIGGERDIRTWLTSGGGSMAKRTTRPGARVPGEVRDGTVPADDGGDRQQDRGAGTDEPPCWRRSPRAGRRTADVAFQLGEITRASPASWRRLSGSRSRQRRSSRRSSSVSSAAGAPSRFRRAARPRSCPNGVALEWSPAGQHFVDDHAKGPEIGSPVDGPAARLLRRHVGGGSEHDMLGCRGEDRGPESSGSYPALLHLDTGRAPWRDRNRAPSRSRRRSA